MIGKLNKYEIEQLITRQLVGRIGCHGGGVTYIVPVSYAYDGEYIYVHSLDGMKLGIMEKNPQVCFQVDDTKNLSNWQSVISWGEFEKLEEEDQKVEALRKLNNRVLPILSSETMHITPEWPFSASNHEIVGGVFFRIGLTQKTGRFERIDDKVFFAT